MHISFKRTGERRYAVIVEVPGRPTVAFDPAPGYDPDIPHDLVHYVVEAALGLTNGVYGRAARGAGSFIHTTEYAGRPRERARQQRKQQRRERALRSQAGAAELELLTSERLAALSDLAWRRRTGQRSDGQRVAPVLPAQDAARVERVVAALARLAPAWRALPVGGQLAFDWPKLEPSAPPPVPRRSAVGTKRLVLARAHRAPAVVVEHARELLGAGERDELARVFEPDAIDQLAEQGRR